MIVLVVYTKYRHNTRQARLELLGCYCLPPWIEQGGHFIVPLVFSQTNDGLELSVHAFLKQHKSYHSKHTPGVPPCIVHLAFKFTVDNRCGQYVNQPE